MGNKSMDISEKISVSRITWAESTKEDTIVKWRLTILMLSVLIASLATGATFAIFTASTAPTQHTFTSGNVTVDLKDDAGNILSAPIMVAQGMAPGDSATYYTNVANTGTLPLSYKIGFSRTDDADANDDALAAALVMGVNRWNGDRWVPIGSKRLSDWVAGGLTFNPALNRDEQARFQFNIHLPIQTNDSAENAEVLVTLTVDALQSRPMPGDTWTFSGPGSTYMSTATGGMEANYNHTIPAWSYDFQTWTWQASTTATQSGTMTFDWRYTGFNAWFAGTASLEAFAVQPDGSEQVVQLQPTTGTWETFFWEGNGSLTVHQGKAWGYRMKAYHYDGTRVWNGAMDIQMTSFTAN